MISPLKRKYLFRPPDRPGIAGGGIRSGMYRARTGNSHGSTGKLWGKHVIHPIGFSGRTLNKGK